MKTALAFSGGKDSWVCLWLNMHRINDITVIWVNTGKNYPEMLAVIDQAKALCPNFVEIIVDRDGQNAYHGIPSDVVPIQWTRDGQIFSGKKEVTVQSYLQCCGENLGMNLQKYCKEQGFTHLIRGQRLDESHKSPARDGDVVEGITYVQPIETWTESEVVEFVGQRMEIPATFRFKHSSMDCYDCTAYHKESKDRITYMKQMHPDLYVAYRTRKDALDHAITQSLTDE